MDSMRAVFCFGMGKCLSLGGILRIGVVGALRLRVRHLRLGNLRDTGDRVNGVNVARRVLAEAGRLFGREDILRLALHA